ncbi:MoxR-like ATPase [Catalinimonas alkaloidigena]|uniref:MoxR-like ATPase n=1 Tax=Catalinimonas alkaloidigena TaxID=1075417 RepID=A0A1G9UNZ7_9BACT|nr:AAA family ATPase [Catalinimonas alkaloidigena]SDM61583.1 MoxR-like ATPase [Catalinimonas alkaloidigena]
MNIQAKIRRILERLSTGVYEKEEAIRLSLLTAVAGESLFLLGPPGVAKSLIARKLKFAFLGGTSFEYLMNRFSTPDEVFGPVSIKKLKDEDKYERLTEKYLPGASIVFLDELWKAGPSIQNALLTVLNEKIYRNGEQEVRVNVKGIIAASNELPAYGQGLEALWDRFLVRYLIREIQTAGNFVQMITDTTDLYADSIADEDKINEEELVQWNQAIDRIDVPAEVVNTLQLIKLKTEQYDQSGEAQFRFEVYDRRWKKMVRLLRTSAFLNGRPNVDLMDCFLVAHCLWNHPDQRETAQEIVAEVIRKHGYTLALNLTPLRQEVRDLETEVRDETRIRNVKLVDKLQPVDREYYEVLNMEQYFDGNRMKRSEFDRLGVDEESTVNLYDAGANLTNRVRARKGQDPHTLIVFYNSRSYDFRLRTTKEEKVEIIYKKPHPLLQSYWQERIEKLQAYIDTQKEKVRHEAPGELNGLRDNLFVDAELADVVEANLRDVHDGLDQLALQLEKIKFSYEQIGEQ